MRIALLYPPPWKIAAPGEPSPGSAGPALEHRPGDLDADFYQTPYGLFSLGAQALRAGHQVKILNLSAFAWTRVDEVVRALEADLWGMSCWTANRRGVAMTAECIRLHHPKAVIIVGGPHATALAPEMLRHHEQIDLVAVGEGEGAFLELVDRISRGQPTTGIAGTVWREGDRVAAGAPRPNVADLDKLASPHDYFDTHIVMTSRGCPWSCTFCAAETTWGRGFRAHSVRYVVDAIANAAERLPVKMVQIKDDTFTTNKSRVIALCRALRERDVRVLWSCDTRVDMLTDELLREMRLAGCERLSLGVESGSPRVLAAIDKKITPDEILASTALAKRYGIRVRYYMMLGNRGETAETFRETLAFLDRAKPHQYLFACLSVYPGTRDFHDAEKAGWLDREVYFTGNFQELKVPFDACDGDTAMLSAWFETHRGLHEPWRESVADYRAILQRLGEHHAAHMDLAGALYHSGDLDGAERHARRAVELGHPCPGLGDNYLACIAHARGDLTAMMDHFSHAANTDPQHGVLIRNVAAARAWFAQNGPVRGTTLALDARHDFSLLERTVQPTLPGPLASGWAEWGRRAIDV